MQSVLARVIPAVATLLLFACGAVDTAGKLQDAVDDAKTETNHSIKLQGTLTSGTASVANLAPASNYTPLDALESHSLYCVTFSTPPTAGTAKSDSSGVVELIMLAKGAPLGCFILDTAGKNIASVVFSAGSTSGMAAKFSSDSDLGTITVDAASGLATVKLPSTGSIASTKDSGAACPYGEWVAGSNAEVGTSCDGVKPSLRFFIAPGSGGSGFASSFIYGPAKMGEANTCEYFNSAAAGNDTEKKITTEYKGGEFIFEYTASGTDCTHVYGAKFKPASGCSEATSELYATNCASCDSGCTGCGNIYCAKTDVIFTRK